MAIANYTASDERDFMLELLNAKKYERLITYTTLVLTQPRRWDDTVNVDEVHITAQRVQSLATYALRGGAGHPSVMGAL